MGFLSIAHSDVGIKKNTNQDSVLIKEAMTDYGEVLLTVVCDGMGGLAKGEVASAALIRAFSSWFEEKFPEILYEKRKDGAIDRMELENELNALVIDVNHKIAEHGRQFHSCGNGNNGSSSASCRGQILYDECRRFQSIYDRL